MLAYAAYKSYKKHKEEKEEGKRPKAPEEALYRKSSEQEHDPQHHHEKEAFTDTMHAQQATHARDYRSSSSATSVTRYDTNAVDQRTVPLESVERKPHGMREFWGLKPKGEKA